MNNSPRYMLASSIRRITKFRGLERLVRIVSPPSSFGEEDSIVLKIDGSQIRVWPTSHVGWHLLHFGCYEPMLRRIIRANLVKGAVAIEIGANIGWHTLLMSEIVGCEGHIHAFEASPAIANEIKYNCMANGIQNCTIHELAIASEPSFMTFKVYAPNSNNAGDGFLQQEENDGDSHLAVVEVRSLDSFEIRRCNFLKIDVEGFEPAVLLGAQLTIETCRPVIVFEHVIEHIERARLKQIDLDAMFSKLSYDLFQFDDRKSPTKIESLLGYSGDVLAVPTERLI